MEQVEDVNDNFPIFGPHRTSISVREDSKWPLVIETLEATDQDEGRFGQVIYKLDDQLDDSKSTIATSTSNVFAIETIDGKGVITLIGELDYEQKSLYQLRILAVDRAIESERLTASTSILISVEDCEDQSPMFTFVPSITRIPENLAIGSNIVRVTAIDGDRGINNPIQYSIVSVNGVESGPEKGLFSIDSHNGQVQVAHELDREWSSPSIWDSNSGSKSGQFKERATNQPGSFVLQVKATEIQQSNATYKQTADDSVTTELTVILTDVNDEAPTFSQTAFYGEILENSASESLVSFIHAPSVGTQSNALTGSDVSNLAFAKVIDRDQGTNGTFTLRLEGQHAYLFEVWPREATNEANILIKLANQPVSSTSRSEEVTETSWLDYEKNKQFQFDIIAREKFSSPSTQGLRMESSASMTVYVKDTNDNYPQFESDLYKVEVPENAIRGMHICTVKAIDLDSGIYGTSGIRYTDIRGEKASKFKLDPLTGTITLKTSDHGFDRESMAQYTMIIEARDSNGLGNRNTTQLLISITDINDQKPRFLLDQYEAFIYENELEFQSPPLVVQAVDNDAPNTPNSMLTYSIVNGDPQQNFTIDPKTGRINVKSSLLFSSNSSSRPELNNDEIDSASHVNGDLRTNDSNSVAVAHVSGLDFESIAQKRDETRQFNLTIKATDSGVPEPLSGYTQVLIVVYDKNDHAPVFTRSIYSKAIREDIREGSQIVQVLALDGDHSPTNSRITYRISSGASDKFVIDSETGLLSVAAGANLDIDRIAGGQKRTNYLLSVLAMDGSFGQSQKSASCLVNISIIDVNNKSPEFISLGTSARQASGQISSIPSMTQQQVVYVNEDAPFGLIVTRVVAVDLDSTSELRYSINYARSEARNEDMMLVEPGLFRDVFLIDPTDGTIKVGKQLDRESFDQIKLKLQVEDIAAETTGQIAHTFLTVKITDINDNRPVFKQPVYKAVVNENSIGGTSIITMTADDRDLNKTLKYSLDGLPEMTRLVRINPRSGEVTVNDKIDRELYPTINVTVKAEDSGHPHPLIGFSQLLISVRDENDNNPIFLNNSRMYQLTLGQSSDTNRVRPFSNHRSQNGLSNQQIGDSFNSIATSASTTRLRSLSPDGSSIESNINDPKVGSTNVLPFLAPGSTVKIREDSQVGLHIAYVRAEDADIDNNGKVTYMLDPSSSGGKFRIDRDSGIISVAGPLDRELVRSYSLIIEACDNYDLGYSTGESRRAFTQVNVQLIDVNDNAPTIRTNMQTQNGLGRQFSELEAFNFEVHRASVGSSYPTNEDIANSPGPYDVPMRDCLFISEFQALNEPILTIVANDLDDPNLDNGKIDLAITNHPLPLASGAIFDLISVPKTSNRVQEFKSTERPEVIEYLMDTRDTSPSLPMVSSMNISDPSSAVAIDSNETEIGLNNTSTMSTTSIHKDPDGEMVGRDDPLIPRAKRSLQGTNQYSVANSQRIPLLKSQSIGSSRESRLFESIDNVIDPSQRFGENLQTQTPKLSSSGTSSLEPGEQQAYLVLVQSLREKVGNYSVMVRATDRGQPALSSIKRINICVQDINNHAPVFQRPPLNHTIRIMENATIGTFVTQVEANDADHGINGELQYSFKATNIPNTNNDWQAFKIDRVSGVITTSKLFNRQIKKYYTIRVQAQDFGRPTSLSSDIDINIMIVNSGLFQPEFAVQHQSVNFTENLAPGSEWITVIPTTNQDDDPALISALDKRQAGNNGQSWPRSSPCYFIVDGDDYEQTFQLDRYTHRLTNQHIIDREKKASYTLIIQATNNCQHPVKSNMGIFGQNQAESEVDKRTGKSLIQGTGSEDLRNITRIKRSPEYSRISLVTSSLKSIPSEPSNTKMIETDSSQNFDKLIAGDKSLLKLYIKVNDVNDNAPKFTQQVYTGGITTEADFGTVFMIVQAIDLDSEVNGQVTYSIVKPIKRSIGSHELGNQEDRKVQGSAKLSRHKRAGGSILNTKPITTTTTTTTVRGNNDILGIQRETFNSTSPSVSNDLEPFNGVDGDDLFLINAQTGEISLNFDPQKHMKGYFEFEIIANDTEGLSDTSMVYIYLLRQDQRVKFILRLTPQELRKRLNKFRSVLGNITGAIVNIDSYKYYENQDGSVDRKKTSLYLHFVNPDDNTIIDVDKVLTLIDNNIEYLDELYKEFHVLSSEAAHLPLTGSALIDPIDQVRTGLMGVSSFLGLILILVIALCLNQRTRYERQLKAATVSAFNGSPLHLDPDYHRQASLPNTNLHSQDPNPIWMNGFAIEHHNDWLNGNSGCALGAGKQGSKGRAKDLTPSPLGVGHNNKTRNTHVNHGMVEIDADYLSSNSGGASNSSDINSLNGQLNHHHHHHGDHNNVHYNNTTTTTTATPRTDSLNSNSNCDESAGSGSSHSNSGSASTTNERQVLCNKSRASQKDKTMTKALTNNNVKHETSGIIIEQQSPIMNQKSLLASGNEMSKFKNRSQLMDTSMDVSIETNGNATMGTNTIGHHSTFGAFKEVTIYTPDNHHQHHQSSGTSNLVRLGAVQQHSTNSPVLTSNQNKRQQQQQQLQQPRRQNKNVVGQVNKIASQFNAKHLAQTSNQNQIYISSCQPQQQQQQQQRSSHKVMVHPNGVDLNQGIIASNGYQQQTSGNGITLDITSNDKGIVQRSFMDNNNRAQIERIAQDDNFENNLSKLSILNLETTEL